MALSLTEKIERLIEAARTLSAEPHLATFGFADTVLQAAGDPRFEADLGSGKMRAAIGFLDGPADGLPAVLEPKGNDHIHIAGRLQNVMNGAEADLLVFVAQAEQGGMDSDALVFAMPATARGVERLPVETLDAGRSVMDFMLDVNLPLDAVAGGRALPLGELQRALDGCTVAMAAEQAALAEDEAALAAVARAAAAYDAGEDVDAATAIARVLADEAALRQTDRPKTLRARANAARLGTTDMQLGRLASLLCQGLVDVPTKGDAATALKLIIKAANENGANKDPALRTRIARAYLALMASDDAPENWQATFSRLGLDVLGENAERVEQGEMSALQRLYISTLG